MKYKLLSIDGKSINNIGDYVQALASAQFLPQIDGYINREALADYDGEECKVIMNGWYMHDSKQWPPSSKIHPLLVSMHINKTVSDDMLKNEGLAYFKKYSPIGCRDTNTQQLLQSKGVNAFFSGCMTLTLGRTYKTTSKGDKVCFVDPSIPLRGGSWLYAKDVLFLMFNISLVKSIAKKMTISQNKIKNVIISARFARLYSKLFTKETLKDAEYISQENSFYASLNNDTKLLEAEKLVKLYAQARLVVTKRIHCALPCLGLETPVYFLQNIDDSEISTCRFGGLADLFNRIFVGSDGLKAEFDHKGKLSKDNIVENKDLWKSLADNLSKICADFVDNNNDFSGN